MRLPVVVLIAVQFIASPAISQKRVAAIHPQPPLKSVESLPEISVSTAALPNIEAANRAARIKMEKFDLAIAGRDLRVLRSVCVGCRTTANWAAHSIKARAEGPEFPIADPAAAPDQ